MSRVKRSFTVADLHKRKFYIDVSHKQPFIVPAGRGKRIPLDSLTADELKHLMHFATSQLRQGVFEDHETLDELRATLYFLSRWSDSASSPQLSLTDRSAKSRSHSTAKDSPKRRIA